MRRAAALALCLFAPAARAYDNVALAGTVSFKKIVGRPSGAAVAPGGDWLVSDAAAGAVKVFGPDGRLKGQVGARGKGPDGLDKPQGVAVDADGTVYVADAGRGRVAVFGQDGKFLRALGEKGAGAGQLDGPRAVAVSHDGVVYVVDAGNSRVQVFNREGIFLLGFGGPGETDGFFKDPAAVAVTPWGGVLVADQKRVQVFSGDGVFQGALERPKPEGKDAPPAPRAVAADAFGGVYVAGEQQKVEEYGFDGKHIASFGTYGTGTGQFKGLAFLAALPAGGVVAVDEALERAQGFKVTAADRPAPAATAPTLRYSVKALERRDVVVDDLAFAGDRLAGVQQKANRVLLAGRRGADAPSYIGEAKPKGPALLKAPAGVSAAGARLLVADAGNGRVAIFDAAGRPDGAVGSPGRREGQFKSPRAVAADAGGRVIAADPEAARVQVFSPDGIYLRTLPGPFQSPVDVAVLSDGRAAVLDAGRKAVLYFDDKGRAAGKPAEGLLAPVSIAADAHSRAVFVYVLDGGDGQVKVVSGHKVVARFGAPALFKAPKAVAVDDRGALWVADAAGARAFRLRLSPLAPATFQAASGEAQAELAWTPDPENMAVSYRLYRSTRPGGEGRAPYRTFTSTETSFVDREIVPGLTYHYALSAVTGEDEGAALEGPRARSSVKTVRPANLPPVDIAEIDLKRLFSSQYKFYEKNPVGRVVIKNNTEKTYQKVRVGFGLQTYMDFVTEKLIERLEPGAREELDLRATFNNKVLSVTEDTPIQAQVTVTYYDGGEEKVFRRTEPLVLYSRNAMSWEDPRRLATFATAKDPAALEFARGPLRDFQKEIDGSPANPALAKAAVVFEALGTYGLTYLKDPNNPFERASESQTAVDYVQYPRETLRRKAGDCDDLAALTAALLEAAGVPTAILDVPGHVLLAFQVDEEAPADPGLPAGSFIERDGVRWVPLETTFVGRPFGEAWDQGAKAVQQTAADRLALIETQDAWAAYPPATLPEEPGPAAPKKEEVAAKFPAGGPAAVAARRLEALSARYEARLKADPKDADAALQLGIVRAEHGRLDESAQAFDQALAARPGDAAALHNRANVHWMKGEAARAAALYAKAAQADPSDAAVKLSWARAAHKAGDKAAAKKAYDAAVAQDAALKKRYATLEEAVK